MLGDITLEKYKEEIEIKLSVERLKVNSWVEELNKPSIILPRRKPVSKTRKNFLLQEESSSDSNEHAYLCECRECIPLMSCDSTKSHTL